MKLELALEDDSLSVADEFAIARALNRKRKDHHVDWTKRYRGSHRAKGLCRNCPRPARPGRVKCIECHQVEVVQQRVRRSGAR